uniref:UPAR/Ly6 domain-containing protein n=1 Tax=Monodelphis domestica TaxID=13616 RepID=A0A5F8HD53_MONDO
GALPSPTIPARRCYYCDMTEITECREIPMHCEKGEDCFIGLAVATGFPHIISKGCMEAMFCGHEQIIVYMGITYNLTTYCCWWELCNTGQLEQLLFEPNVSTMTAVLIGLLVFLILCWLV